MKVLFALILTCCILVNGLFAQSKLSLNEAIENAMKNNFQILIAENEAQILSNNNTIGNAGFLPSIGIGASQNASLNNTRQVYFSGAEREATNAFSNSISGNIAMNWTVFDGMQMFVDKQRLNTLEQMGKIQLRSSIENILFQTITSYYECVIEEKKMDVLKKILEISGERKEIVSKRYLLGNASLPELNQSEIYYNTDSAAYLNQLLKVFVAKNELNYLMGIETGKTFITTSEIPEIKILNITEIMEKISQQNNEIKIMRQALVLSDLNIKKSQSVLYPKLSVFGGYNALSSESEVGILQSNRSQGLNFGVNASFSLFNGLTTRTNIHNNKLQYENSIIALKQTEYHIQKEVMIAYNNFITNVNLVFLSEKNLKNAQSNLISSMEVYKQGKMSEIEFREKQLSLLEAENNLLNSRKQAKFSETLLLLYCGDLLKD